MAPTYPPEEESEITVPKRAFHGTVGKTKASKSKALSDKKETQSTIENGTVLPPRRVKNKERRSREHLTPSEVGELMTVARKRSRYGHRDATMIMLAYRHGLRVSELVSLRWDQIDLKQGLVHVSRLKQGTASVHPLRGPELRALRRLERELPNSPYVFVSERGGPVSAVGFRKMLSRTGEVSSIGFPVHPHMLRHGVRPLLDLRL